MKRDPDDLPTQADPPEMGPGMVLTLIVLLFFVFIVLMVGLVATLGRWLLVPMIMFVGWAFARWRKWW